MTQKENKKFITLQECANELGLHYETWNKKYTAFCEKHGLGIYRIDGTRNKLLNRSDFYRAVESTQVN